jgi:hypothetical protein
MRLARSCLATLLLAFLLSGTPALAQQPPPPAPAPGAPAPGAPGAPGTPPPLEHNPALQYTIAVAFLVLFLVIVCMPSRKA